MDSVERACLNHFDFVIIIKPKDHANIGKKEKQTVKILNKKITELETEVANLKEENNQLKTELHQIKQVKYWRKRQRRNQTILILLKMMRKQKILREKEKKDH